MYKLTKVVLMMLCFFIFIDAKAQIKLQSNEILVLKRYFHSRLNTEWSWATLSYSNDSLQKHWIVANRDDPNPGRHTFFVTGHDLFIFGHYCCST